MNSDNEHLSFSQNTELSAELEELADEMLETTERFGPYNHTFRSFETMSYL